MNSGIFTNFNIFTIFLDIAIPIMTFFVTNLKNSRSNPSYYYCDFPSRMTIQAKKWKFSNHSKFSLVIIVRKNYRAYLPLNQILFSKVAIPELFEVLQVPHFLPIDKVYRILMKNLPIL